MMLMLMLINITTSCSEGKSAIIADQTGTGKTLSYLLPLIQRLKEQEARSGIAVIISDIVIFLCIKMIESMRFCMPCYFKQHIFII